MNKKIVFAVVLAVSCTSAFAKEVKKGPSEAILCGSEYSHKTLPTQSEGSSTKVVKATSSAEVAK